MPDENRSIDLMIAEYNACLDGYNSRDRMANDLFYKLIHMFQIFLLIIAFISALVSFSDRYHWFCCVTIGVIGFLSMFSLLIGLESVSSAKVALRERCIDLELKLEELLPEGHTLKYWQVIHERDKYPEESFIKGNSVKGLSKEARKKDLKEIREAKSIFIWTSRIVIVFWLAITFYIAFYGPNFGIGKNVIDIIKP